MIRAKQRVLLAAGCKRRREKAALRMCSRFVSAICAPIGVLAAAARAKTTTRHQADEREQRADAKNGGERDECRRVGAT